MASQEGINTLFVLQKKCLRFIQLKDRLSPSSELFSDKILPLPVMNDYFLLVLAFKIKNNLVKNNIAVQYVNDVHRYGTRQVGNFYVVNSDTRFFAADFYRRGLIKFNEMNDSLKKISSLGVFKNRVREFLYDEFEKGSRASRH